MFNALGIIEPVVQKHNLTLLETALRWVVHHSALKVKDGGHDGIIIGVSSLNQLQGNITDLEKGPLPDEVVQVLDQAWDGIKYQGPSYWR
jgi:aflatoxin B1 aldehyde reductase